MDDTKMKFNIKIKIINFFENCLRTLNPNKVKRLIPTQIYEYFKRNILKLANNTDYYCPICKQNIQFEEYDFKNGVPIHEIECYNCRSRVRDRVIYLYLNRINFFNEKKRIKILHFAPEHFFYKLFKNNENIDYNCSDFDPNQIMFKNMDLIKIDITNIQYKNNSFDFIFCNHVLEHIPNDIKAMKELYRILKVGGWGIIQVPIDYNRLNTYEDSNLQTFKEREKAFGSGEHVRLYGRDYVNRLESVGFRVEENEFVRSLDDNTIKRYGLLKSELINIVYKD